MTRVPETPSGPRPAQCCEFGWSDKSHPAPLGPRLFVDSRGFHNHLCDVHYTALVVGLRRTWERRADIRPAHLGYRPRRRGGTLPLRERG